MIGKRAVAVAIAILSQGCDSGSPAVPTPAPAPEAAAPIVEAGPPVICPPGIDASFGSIYVELLKPPQTCGSTSGSCHLRDDDAGIFPTSNLAYSYDASAVYAELLGDGGGAPAFNANHPDAAVLRVDPGHADASMLYIKLTIGANDPTYGFGMPYGAPGTVCPAAVSAVADWINAGAPQN